MRIWPTTPIATVAPGRTAAETKRLANERNAAAHQTRQRQEADHHRRLTELDEMTRRARAGIRGGVRPPTSASAASSTLAERTRDARQTILRLAAAGNADAIADLRVASSWFPGADSMIQRLSDAAIAQAAAAYLRDAYGIAPPAPAGHAPQPTLASQIYAQRNAGGAR